MAWVTVFLAVALAWALARQRRLALRLDQMTQSYWELRYQYGQLRSRINQLDHLDEEPPAPAPEPPQAFIPLSSLKRDKHVS